jgi:hypothetical protein
MTEVVILPCDKSGDTFFTFVQPPVEAALQVQVLVPHAQDPFQVGGCVSYSSNYSLRAFHRYVRTSW